MSVTEIQIITGVFWGLGMLHLVGMCLKLFRKPRLIHADRFAEAT
jgi:hypothetical protein